MKRVAIFSLLLILLTGCVSNNPINIIPPPVAHPSLPKAVEPVKIEQSGMVISGKSYVVMDVKNNQALRSYMEDMLRYIKNINSLACSYRQELEEPFCNNK